MPKAQVPLLNTTNTKSTAQKQPRELKLSQERKSKGNTQENAITIDSEEEPEETTENKQNEEKREEKETKSEKEEQKENEKSDLGDNEEDFDLEPTSTINTTTTTNTSTSTTPSGEPKAQPTSTSGEDKTTSDCTVLLIVKDEWAVEQVQMLQRYALNLCR